MTMFAAEYEAARLDDLRRSPRAPVSIDASIGKSKRTLCKVIDVSRHGVRLATHCPLVRGSTIWLTLPRLGPVLVEVRWANDFSAGCEFEKPLNLGTLEMLLAEGESKD
jgi:hypothetical protein